MKELNNFLDKLMLESGKSKGRYNVLDEEGPSKDLAKEDALALIAAFVKDVKKKFPKSEDRIEIIKDASKTLEFYMNEISNSEEVDNYNDDEFDDVKPLDFD